MSALEQNQQKLSGFLSQLQSTGIKNRIAGRDVDGSGGIFQSTSPVDKSLICDVAHGTSADIDSAAQAASNSFASWRDMPAAERRKILIKVAEGIEARAEEIALCECWDTDRPCVLCPKRLCVAQRIFATLQIR